MLKAAPFSCLIAGCLALGCSTMRPQGTSEHRGITEHNPNAVTRVFPTATATLVAQRMADVMSSEAILENVAMKHDPASRECRNFTRLERQALGISLLTPANDVNFDITAKSKDGSTVAVAVRLKGESGSEVSVLYGFAGDPDLSRDLLDRTEAALATSAQDPGVKKTADSSRPSAAR